MNAARIVVCVVILAGAGVVCAGEPKVAATINVPSQPVPGTELFFEVQAKVYQDQGASGFLALGPRGALRVYDVISGIAKRDTKTDEVSVMLFVQEADGGAGFAVAASTPDPGIEGCDIWDFNSNNVHDADATFPAMGDLTLLRGDPDPTQGDDAPDVALIGAPPEVVEVHQILPDGSMQTFLAGFQASLRSLQNHRANGFIEFQLPDHDPVAYEPLFGTVVETAETGPVVIIFLLRIGPDDPLGHGDGVYVNVHTLEDGVLDLDLVGNSTVSAFAGEGDLIVIRGSGFDP